MSTEWWRRRFGWLTAERIPPLRPGNGARRAFFRPEPALSITLPRRYRTRGVVLHELVHWGLDDSDGIADHGPTFTRVLLDATSALIGKPRANALVRAYHEHGVKIGAPGLVDERGWVRYGWDERLERRRRQPVMIVTPGLVHTTAVFLGWGRGHLTIRIELEGGDRTSVPISGLLDVLVPEPDDDFLDQPLLDLDSFDDDDVDGEW